MTERFVGRCLDCGAEAVSTDGAPASMRHALDCPNAPNPHPPGSLAAAMFDVEREFGALGRAYAEVVREAAVRLAAVGRALRRPR